MKSACQRMFEALECTVIFFALGDTDTEKKRRLAPGRVLCNDLFQRNNGNIRAITVHIRERTVILTGQLFRFFRRKTEYYQVSCRDFRYSNPYARSCSFSLFIPKKTVSPKFFLDHASGLTEKVERSDHVDRGVISDRTGNRISACRLDIIDCDQFFGVHLQKAIDLGTIPNCKTLCFVSAPHPMRYEGPLPAWRVSGLA